jgi:flavin reductase (DIM6/NTAB) family NADH-FMN oxidoreductase RutF
MKESLGAKTFMLPTPVLLVGTYDRNGRPNIMTAAWGGICASEPPAIAVSVRRNRWTYDAVVEKQAFTISIPSCALAAQADFAGIKSGKDMDKFEVLGLTPVRGGHVDAPYVDECPVVIELKLLQSVEIGSHVQFIGEIIDVKIDSDCLDGKLPDVKKIDPLFFIPLLQQYWGIGDAVAKAFSVGLTAADAKKND